METKLEFETATRSRSTTRPSRWVRSRRCSASPGAASTIGCWNGGDTGFNFGADFGRLDAYIASTKKMRELAQHQQIDVLISNHSGIDLAPAKLAELRKDPNGRNLFVLGVPAVGRALHRDGRLRHGPARPLHPAGPEVGPHASRRASESDHPDPRVIEMACGALP